MKIEARGSIEEYSRKVRGGVEEYSRKARGGVEEYTRKARGGDAPNPKDEVTRSPFTESRLGRTKKQSNARPKVWQILVEEKLRHVCMRITQTTSMTATKVK